MHGFFGELIGTMTLILLGNGVVAGVSLKGSYAENGGWIVITTAWGLAVICAVIVALDPFFIQQAPQIAAQAMKHHLPSIFAFREAAEAGGLMSYGQNQVDIYRRAAGYVDRILKGIKPADLPVEQPTTLELFVNGKTAKALGLSIPHSLLISADKVIE